MQLFWNCTLKIELQKLLKDWGRYATMNTREGGVDAPLGCSKWEECGYPKSQDGRSNLTQFLTFLLDFALDATTFTVLDFFGF